LIFKEAEKDSLEVENLVLLQSNDIVLDNTQESKEIYENLRHIKSQIKKLEIDQVRYENKLKVLIRENEGIKDIATWKSQTSIRLDTKRIKEEKPELYEQYAKETSTRVLRLL